MWEIVLQEVKNKEETFDVECKELVWRPASEKEGGKFKKIGYPTYRILFQHKMDQGKIFKIVAQFRSSGKRPPEWRLNLHDPDQERPVELIMRNRVSVVTLDHPFETKTVKHSTGTVPYRTFFRDKFPERIRNEEFRNYCKVLLDNALSERIDVEAIAA